MIVDSCACVLIWVNRARLRPHFVCVRSRAIRDDPNLERKLLFPAFAPQTTTRDATISPEATNALT
jgi:hypothetical protein